MNPFFAVNSQVRRNIGLDVGTDSLLSEDATLLRPEPLVRPTFDYRRPLSPLPELFRTNTADLQNRFWEFQSGRRASDVNSLYRLIDNLIKQLLAGEAQVNKLYRKCTERQEKLENLSAVCVSLESRNKKLESHVRYQAFQLQQLQQMQLVALLQQQREASRTQYRTSVEELSPPRRVHIPVPAPFRPTTSFRSTRSGYSSD